MLAPYPSTYRALAQILEHIGRALERAAAGGRAAERLDFLAHGRLVARQVAGRISESACNSVLDGTNVRFFGSCAPKRTGSFRPLPAARLLRAPFRPFSGCGCLLRSGHRVK